MLAAAVVGAAGRWVAAGAAGAPGPLIGITCKVEKDRAVVPLAYARAIREAGGVPVVVPIVLDEKLAGEYVRRLDGLVLTGGKDVPPQAYGEKPHASVKVLPDARWEFERRLAAAWLKGDKPLLGICLGAQVANVAAGGSLIQDIPSQVGTAVVHRRKGGARHEVAIEPDSRLRKLLGADRAEVNSSHHQAVKRVGRGLRVVARSADGVVEALEAPGKRWLLLVQWHPERMARAHRLAIFGAFVRACRKPGW